MNWLRLTGRVRYVSLLLVRLLGFLTAALLVNGSSHAALMEPSKGPTPSWVKRIDLEADAFVPVEQIRGGVYYLLVDRQTRVAGNDRQQFNRYAIKAVNDKGLEHAANIDIEFDPTFQRLQLHTLAVHRNGRVISQLNTAPIRTLQREKDLEAQVLDGRLTASFFVQDVRVGDVVEYAYTLDGVHPSMKGGHFGGFTMQWGDPVHAVYMRLLWPTKRPIAFKSLNLGERAVESERGGVRQYEWVAKSVPGLRLDANVPAWFDPYPYVQWSSFRDWSEVSQWAVPLYAPPALPGGELREEVERIQRSFSDTSDRIAAVLQYVQKSIRYLSLDVGVGSYTPSPPSTVMARRFGDCKDKTLLTLTMLNALGIEARAALVNTRLREGVMQSAPSPGAFDHVLVHVQVHGQSYWIDPTRYPQPGRLDAISQPYFGYALIVDPATKALVPMQRSRAMQSTRNIHTVFDATPGVGKPVSMTVTTELQGLSAERMRDNMSRSNQGELQRQYLNFYAGYYPGIEVQSPMTVEDDSQANAMKVVEHYRIVDFWTQDDKQGMLAAKIKAPDMLSQLSEPNDRVRKAPLAIDHAVEIESFAEVRLPEDWKVEPYEAAIHHPAFEFTYKLTTTPRLLTQASRYVSLSDHVEAEDMLDYVKKMQSARDAMWLKLTHNQAAATSKPDKKNVAQLDSLGWPVVLYVLLLSATSYWIGRKMYRYNPMQALTVSSVSSQPLRGWVFAFGIFLVVSLIDGLRQLWPFYSVFLGDVWNFLQAGGESGYQPKATWVNLLVLGFATLWLTPYVVQLFLYFGRRSSIPRVTFWLQGVVVVVALAILILNGVVYGAVSGGDMAQIYDLAGFIFSLIGCIYILRSERAKLTFVRHYGEMPDQKSAFRNQPDVVEDSAPRVLPPEQGV